MGVVVVGREQCLDGLPFALADEGQDDAERLSALVLSAAVASAGSAMRMKWMRFLVMRTPSTERRQFLYGTFGSSGRMRTLYGSSSVMASVNRLGGGRGEWRSRGD